MLRRLILRGGLVRNCGLRNDGFRKKPGCFCQIIVYITLLCIVVGFSATP